MSSRSRSPERRGGKEMAGTCHERHKRPRLRSPEGRQGLSHERRSRSPEGAKGHENTEDEDKDDFTTKPPKKQKKSVEEKGEDVSTWSQKRLNQASLGEQLYDINFNYLDNKELAAVVTFLTLKNVRGESVRQ